MDKTNIEYFNDYLKKFVSDTKETFPEFKEILETYYSDLLESDTCNDDKHVKRFMRKIGDYKELISTKNRELFDRELFILKHVDFQKIFESAELSEKNEASIWSYLQTLYVLGESIISDSEKVKNLVENFQKFKNNEEPTTEEDAELMGMLKNLSQTHEDQSANDSNDANVGGLIGQLAQELSEEINMDSMGLNIDDNSSTDQLFSNLIRGDNPMKFMNLIQTVGKKIQDKVSNTGLNQDDLIKEATGMLSGMKDNAMFSNLMNNMNPNANANETSNPTRDRLRRKLDKKK
jgi:hypothetical protein